MRVVVLDALGNIGQSDASPFLCKRAWHFNFMQIVIGYPR